MQNLPFHGKIYFLGWAYVQQTKQDCSFRMTALLWHPKTSTFISVPDASLFSFSALIQTDAEALLPSLPSYLSLLYKEWTTKGGRLLTTSPMDGLMAPRTTSRDVFLSLYSYYNTSIFFLQEIPVYV